MQRCVGACRAPARLVVLMLVASLALAGCTHGSSSVPLPASTLTTTGPFPTVTGGFGDQPSIAFAKGTVPSAKLQRRVVHLGTGSALAIGDLIAADYVGQIWNGKVFENSYRSGQAATLQVGLGKLLTGLDSGLVGLPVGSRVELTVPPSDGYGSAGNKTEGIAGSDTLVFVLDIAKRYNGKSSADPAGLVTAQPAGLPVVSGPLSAAPLIIFPKHVALPAKRSTFLLARGHGAPLKQGTAVVQYYSVNGHGSFVGSTWLTGTPTSVPVGDAVDATGGVFDGLVGVPIGSRVLIVAPAAAGKTQATDTAVVAVDILDQVTTAKRMADSS